MFLLLGLFFTSCTVDEDGGTLSGSTTREYEDADYSTFLAEVADLFTTKTAETKATTTVKSSHIGYANEDNPNVAVVFEGVSEPVEYLYDVSEEYYYLDEEVVIPESNGYYIYSTDEDIDCHGALVAALFPADYQVQTHNAISLKNMKARISVSYKFEQEGTTNQVSVDSVYIGSVYTDGEFSIVENGTVLKYVPTTNSAEGDVETYEVNTASNILSDSDDSNYFTTGTFEAFIIPQSMTAFEDYVIFYIEGEAYKYFLSSNLTAEANVTYNYVFSISQTDNDVSLKIESQSSVQEWEAAQGLAIDVNPNEPYLSEWDGSASSLFAFGDGTEADPYLIESAANLKYFLTSMSVATYQSAHYKLMINIDWKGMAWTNFNTFGGVFDGNDKYVKNVALTYSYQKGGFFGANTAGAIIKNLTVKGNFYGSDDKSNANYGTMGGVVGSMTSLSYVHNCHFEGTVHSGYQVGGIVGVCWGGEVIGCTCKNSTIISEYNEEDSRGIAASKIGYAGPIMAYFGQNTTISHCYAENNYVQGYSWQIAGISGKITNNANTSITSCYVTDDNTFSCIDTIYYALTGRASSTATTTYSYFTKCYHSDKGAIDTLYYLDIDSLGAQGVANWLNNGKNSVFTPENSTEWYWKVETGAKYPTPSYYPSEIN